MVRLVDEEFQQHVNELTLDHTTIADGEFDDDGRPKRTGTAFSASAHIITAIIGSGVLSLAWAMAQLGWLIGIASLLIFALITLYSSTLLADCYRSPDPVTGKRNPTYMAAVRANLGEKKSKLLGLVQYTYICGLSVGYTITAATSMATVLKSDCFHKRGHGISCNGYSSNAYMIAMGIIEILLSLIPNLHEMSWISVIAATMSFGYALIGMGLSFAKVVSGDGGRTTLTGVEVGPDFSAADKTWAMFRAIGDVAFACVYAEILVEVQDTLKSPPAENKVMKTANTIAILISTAFYLLCGCLGYAALGNLAPGNILTGFGFYEPFWLIDLANLFVVVHLLGAYQVLSQPVFHALESWASSRWPESNFVSKEYPIIVGKKKSVVSVNLLRLTVRASYVILVTVLAMALPFFNDVLALLGAIGYWPMTVYFPVEMYIAQTKMKRRTVKWLGLQLLNLVCLLVAIAAACGAIQGLQNSLKNSKPFRF